jgi:putative peptidoglycan lipid II flippase
LLALSLATTFAPELASAAARGRFDVLRAQISRGLRLTAVVIAPAVALYLGLARPVIVALLQRGAFDAGDATQVADTLVAFAVGLLPFSLYLFSLRAFTSRLDTRTPFLLNCVENAVNIALAFPLYAWLGIPGLALAFSLAYFVGCGLTLFVLHRDLHGIDARHLANTGVRVVAAAAVVGLVAWASAELIGWSTTIEAVLATIVGAVAGALVYLGLLVLLRVDEVKLLAALIPRRAATSARV